LLRAALVGALAVVVAGVAATVAHGLAFNDAVPCHDETVFVCPEGAVNSSYSITFQSYGGCGPALPYQYRATNGSLPPGLSLSSGGTISGVPSASGTYRFWVQLSDEDPPSQSWCLPKKADREFSITIQPGLQITTNNVPQNATVGQAYSAQLEAQVVTNLNPLTGSPASGASWTVVSGVGTGLPPGLALANGLISGTPTTEGAYTFRIQATLNGVSHFQTYSLTVRQPLVVTASKPLATSPAPTLWEIGVPFSSKLTPSGGSGTYTFALGPGSLPPGITLGPDGTLSGTPSTEGVYRATVRLTDNEGRTLDYAANFGVAARLKVATLALRVGKVGRLYRSKLTTTGGIAPRNWKVTVGPLPKGIRLDRTTGVLSGTPTKAGRYRLTFQVTDGLKVVASKRLRIDVLPS
jgi:hypothetical protein